MGILGALFRALQSLLCGSTSQKPDTQQQQQQHYPPQQQPQYPPHQQQPQYPPHQQQPQYPPHQQQPQYPPHQQQPQYPPHQQQPPYPPQQPHYPPHQTQHYPPHNEKPPSHPQPHKPYFDDNKHNQANPHYQDLRARAHREGAEMGRCFEESKRAYESGNGALAKELSNQGKAHQKEMERLHAEASAWIFRENNRDSAPHEIDLHGLYVKEAIAQTERAIQAAQSRGDTKIHLIVGKGMHSEGKVAKVKPAIEELMRKYQLAAHLDPENEGVLIVDLGAPDRGMDPDEIGRRIEDKNESCIIM